MRYRTAVSLALVALVVLAGCGGGGGDSSDDGPIVATAAPASVDGAALSATGYERVERSNQTTNTTLTVSVQGDVELNPTFEVRATTSRVVYERAVEGETAAVGVLSVPGVNPSDTLRTPRNPFGDRSPAALATNATTYTVESPQPIDNATVGLLGNETPLRRYAATGERDGTALPVTVYIATVRHEGDFVSLVAVVPREATADERDHVVRLAGELRH